MNASVMLNHDDDAMQVGKKQLKKRKRSVVQWVPMAQKEGTLRDSNGYILAHAM